MHVAISLSHKSQCPLFLRYCLFTPGTVVQSWVSANPGFKFNTVFQFVYFCMSVYFKTSKKRIPIHPDKISEEIFLNSCVQAVEKLAVTLHSNFSISA